MNPQDEQESPTWLLSGVAAPRWSRTSIDLSTLYGRPELGSDAMKRPSFSLGFLCAMTGVAVTLLGFLDIWFWPAWPAFTALQLLFGRTDWTALPYGLRAAIMVGLVAVNIGFWALATWLVVWLWKKIASTQV